MAQETFLTVQEAGRALRRSVKAVRRYVKEGRLQAARPSGTPQGSLLIPRSEIDKLLAFEQEPAAAANVRRGGGG